MKPSYEELEQLKINLGEAASPLLVDPINKAIDILKGDQEKDALIQEYQADNKRLNDRITDLEKSLEKETKRKEWFLYRKIVGNECDEQGLGVMSYVIHKDHDLRGELFEAIERAQYIGKRLSDSVIATGRTPDEAIDAAMEAEK